MMMDDADSFTTVLKDLEALSSKRDPRSVRLAAVTAALLEVVGDDVSPAKVYASTIQSLEQTLGSLQTQVALLELLTKTVPHVSSAAIGATIPVSSRTLRAVVTACQEASNTEMETKDGLGGVNATLRGVIRASNEVLKKLPSNTPEKAVKSLFHGTILSLFEDRRPKVRKASQNAATELIMQEKPCHSAIKQSIQSYAKVRLEKSGKNVNAENAHLLHLLAFLEQRIAALEVHVDVMELVMVTLQADNNSTDDDFVSSVSRKDITHKILLINGLLSCLEAYLESDNADDEFAAGVLASLLQARPTMLLRSGSCDEALVDSGRTLYGRVLLLTCQRTLQSDRKVGCKLFPLVIQMVLQLSRPSDEAPAVEVAQTLMVELTRTFRISLSPIVELEPCPAEATICLEDSLRAMEQVLHHSFRSTWNVTLQALAFLLHLMKDSDKAPAVVESLVQLHSLVTADASARESVESSVSSLIQGIGIEIFWDWTSWMSPKAVVAKKKSKKQYGVIGTDRAWLLPLMRASSMAVHPQRPSLAFFQMKILDLARQCDAYGALHPATASFHQARVIDLWSLFPCFCRNPMDLEVTFPTLSQTLVRAMGDTRYPQLVNIICGGLRILATDFYERRCVEGEPLDAEEGNGTGSSVEQDANVLAQASTKILPSLFKLIEQIQGNSTEVSGEGEMMDLDHVTKGGSKNMTLDSQRSQSAIDAIAALAKLAPKPCLQSLFKKIMQRLLAASQSEEDETEKICTLLNLSQALVTSQALDDASISLLYRAIKPFIRSDEHQGRVQKRAYKVLFEICQCHPSFVAETELLQELTELLLDSIMTSQVTARHMRLKCMALIVQGFEDGNVEHNAVIAKIIPEVLLCLKDSNGKAREAAYQLLVSMAAIHENKTEIFRVIAAALGAQTAHMRSAAVMAMSRLVFEYARVDDSVYELLPSLLQTVIVLFDEDSREVIKSVVGFVRVSVAAMTPEQLEPLLPDLVGGLLKYHKGKDRFRSKIKIIIKKLVRMYGYDTLMPLIPESDTRLLTHMRKLSERAARRKAAQQQDSGLEKDAFDDLMESDEEDSDDGRTLMTGATGFTRMTGRTGKSIRSAAAEKSIAGQSRAASTVRSSRSRKVENAPRLRAETNGEVMDMLDPKMAENVRLTEADNYSDDSDSDTGMMEFDEMGRLIVPEDSDEVGDEDDKSAVPSKRQRISKFESAKAAKAEVNNKKSKKQQVQSLGSAYKSKKAGGDVKKKGQKYEPYAYVPLDGKSYTKKNRRKTVEQMSTVVRQSGKRKR